MTEAAYAAQTPSVPLPARWRALPWSTLVPLALVMDFADEFWVISLRGAAGAMERTQGPFASWLAESVLVLPVFLGAVLAALALALRLSGPVLRGRWALGRAVLLVAGAGFLAGATVLVASSAWDLRLELGHVAAMSTTTGTCAAACRRGLDTATWVLQAKSVVYGSALLLATNAVLVVWVVALRGGRLDVTSPSGRRARPLPTPFPPAPLLVGRDLGRDLDRDLGRDLRWVGAAALTGAAVVHLAVVPEHLADWSAAGVFFVLLAVAEVGVALLVLRQPNRAVVWLVALASVGPLALWAWSRAVGLPFGPEAGVAEAVGPADVAACFLTLTSLAAAVALLAGGRRLRRPRVSAYTAGLVLAGVASVTALGIGGSGLGWWAEFAPGGHTTAVGTQTP